MKIQTRCYVCFEISKTTKSVFGSKIEESKIYDKYYSLKLKGMHRIVWLEKCVQQK